MTLKLVRATSLLVLCQMAALGAPFAKKIPFTQPDGTQIVLWGKGDEFYAVFETLEGYTVMFDQQTQAYEYAGLSADGDQLISMGVAVGRGDPTALGLKPHLRISPVAVRKQAAERFARWDQAMEVTRRWSDLKTARGMAALAGAEEGVEPSPPSFTTTGQKLGLTLLIDFSDEVATIPQAEIINFCNGDSYTGYGNNGSVKKYYLDNSNNQLTYSNVVTIYIRVPHPKTYYNNTAVDCGTEGRLLITDAINTMKALPNYTTDILPTFANLTVDGSSQVVACNVFFAGADSGVWSYGLWPHSWVLGSAVSLGNGKRVYKYQITNTGTSLALGTFCHENGHMLCGFPDLYDYGYDSIGGAGVFCLMGYGASGGNPVQICAYLKRAAGWATTVALTSSSSLTASVASSGTDFNKFYRYAKPGVATEYFLVENRQKSGRDANLPAAGVAIWHVDELGDRDNQSTNFNASHLNYELSLMQADNLWHFQNDANYGDAKDLYYVGNTATGYANRFSDATSPSARWWDGSASSIIFHDFSSSGATMTFGVGAEGPMIVLDSATLTAEGCIPANGAVDPDETVTFNFGLKNSGGGNTVNLVATLLAANGVAVPSGPQTYGILVANGSAVTQPFSFTATGSCGGTNIASLQLQDGTTNLGTLTFSFRLGQPSATTVFSEHFDGVTAPALPADWTTLTSGGQSSWVTSTSARDSNPNSVFSPDPTTAGVNELDSPTITLPAGEAQLSFRHNYDLESTYDGGVLEIRIGGGGWTDILTAGGGFVSGGYITTLSTASGNPLGGRSAWTGNSGGFISTVVNLPATASGQAIQLRWRCGSDGSVGGVGWYVDTVSITNSRFTCCSQSTLSLAGTLGYYPASYSPGAVVPGAGVSGVTMTVTEGTIPSVVTQPDGSYSFNNVPIGGTYTVTPSKTDDSPTENGVDSFDQSLIQRHILGRTLLDSPYKLLAADVDGSGQIDSFDQTSIQRLILGRDTQFPAGLWHPAGLWRFVPSDYVFPDPQTAPNTPWDAPANRSYDNLMTGVANADFVAIKFGDVDDTWTAPPSGQNVLAKNANRLEALVTEAVPKVGFAVSQQSAQPGQTVAAQVTVSGFGQVTSAQFSLAWDPAVLRYVGTGRYALRGLAGGSFGTKLTESGKLGFAWYDPEADGVTLADGTVLFTVRFEVIGKAGSSSAVALSGAPVGQEVSVEVARVTFGAQDGNVSVVGPGTVVSNPRYANGAFRLSVPTEQGRSYVLEYSDVLAPAKWTALPAVAGDGTVIVLSDRAATNQHRFYRIRAQQPARSPN